MGYDLHITRRQHWSDPEGTKISLDEWLTYVNGDNELEFSDGYLVDLEGMLQSTTGFCEWNAHPVMRKTPGRPVLGLTTGMEPSTQKIRIYL